MKFRTALVAVFLASGCKMFRPSSPMRWAKTDATQHEFLKDRYECLEAARQRESDSFVYGHTGAASSKVVANCGVWLSCLAARGYSPSEDGKLTVPEELGVKCAE